MSIRVIDSLNEYEGMAETSVALGNFDGVHIGHARLIKKTAEASQKGLEPCAVIFERDPENVIAGAPVSKYITDNKTKVEILEEMGIKTVFFLDFNKYRNLSPEDFADLLKNRLKAAFLVCGFHYRFGKGAAGNAQLLKKLAEERGMDIHIESPVIKDGILVSSTLIRNLVSAGKVDRASEYLGRYFTVTGEVVPGKHLGHLLGFPTVNQDADENQCLPASGVYITRVTADGKLYGGVTNVGVRPTVENTLRSNIETNILDYDGDLYGKSIRVEFISMIRPEKKFRDTEELTAAVLSDKASAAAFFDNNKKYLQQ